MIKKAEYLISNTDITKCPEKPLPEFAFIGRSNVGKSSLINMLTGIKNLAKTSSTPGKTQTINHFLIDDTWYLADLPGYGYAQVSKSLRGRWEHFIRNYLLHRENLTQVFVLLDCRIKPMNSDMEFINWLGKNQVPMGIIYTKIDKLKPSELEKNIQLYEETLLTFWEDLPVSFISSSVKSTGKEDIVTYIEEIVTQMNLKKTR